MQAIFENLPDKALVLDLGCDAGSFPLERDGIVVIRLDLEPRSRMERFVRADAAHLPFGDGSFDAIVSNHSLEHFEELDLALREMGRVLKPGGSLYAGVPDATTFCDRLYRWLANGGGHVNQFRSAPELAKRIQTSTGVPHAGTRTLCTSLSYLNWRNRKGRAPRRLVLLGGGSERVLVAASYLFRMSDRWFKTRLSVYGWALYFGPLRSPVEGVAWSNVCVRCGSGYSSDWLLSEGRVTRRLLRVYHCAACGAANLFTEDRRFGFG